MATFSPIKNKLMPQGGPAPGPYQDASAEAYPLGTMAPGAAPKSPVNPLAFAANFMPQQRKPDAMYAFAETLERTLTPDAARQRVEEEKSGQADKLKQGLAFVQQLRALPVAQRYQMAQAGMKQFGLNASLDPAGFTDEALAQSEAALSAQMGIGPAAPQDPLEINNQLVDPRTGQVMGDYRDPQKPVTVNNRLVNPETGSVIGDYSDPAMPKTYNTGQAIVSIDPVTNKPTVLYRDPQQQGGAIGGFRTLSPQESEARGYPKGTVVQIDNRGAEYVRSRPSTAQTGQPTEGERNAGMHVTVALNGLQKLVDMEGSGYNRAGFGEQFSTLFGENEKLYDQSAAEFIDGYLRAMTGAAATSTEIDTYRKQWFPQFGDTAAVVKQKAAGRLNALRGMKSKAGRAWNPSWDGVLAQLEQQVGSAASNIAPPPSTPAAGGGEDLTSYSTEELEQMLAELGQ